MAIDGQSELLSSFRYLSERHHHFTLLYSLALRCFNLNNKVIRQNEKCNEKKNTRINFVKLINRYSVFHDSQ
jgi:hypothetical protein